MAKIKLNKITIEVPKEIKKIYFRDQVFDTEEWLKILKSNGYKNGEITIDTLKWLTDDKTNNKHHLLNVLSSNNYAYGIVTEEDLKLLESIGTHNNKEKNHTTILENAQARYLACILTGTVGNGIDTYKKGLIPHETLKLITHTKGLQGSTNYYHPRYFFKILTCSNYANGLISEAKIQQFLNIDNIQQAEILLEILKSKNYALGIISEDMINKSLETKNSGQISTFLELITSVLYENKMINDEILELILYNDDELTSSIISEINNSFVIREEDKIYYIEAILKLENKEKLNSLYKEYKEYKYIENMQEFASQFVLYALPMIKIESKKKILQQNNIYNSFNYIKRHTSFIFKFIIIKIFGGLMNKELKIIIEELSEIFSCRSRVKTVANEFYRMPIELHSKALNKESMDAINEYIKNTISEIIELARIERLYDLKEITEEEKQTLINNYHEYHELYNIIASDKFKDFLKESSTTNISHIYPKKNNNNKNKKLEERFYFLEKTLTQYGILDPFNYEEALVNQIDFEIKKRTLHK